jgi:hypothetical protein
MKKYPNEEFGAANTRTSLSKEYAEELRNAEYIKDLEVEILQIDKNLNERPISKNERVFTIGWFACDPQ